MVLGCLLGGWQLGCRHTTVGPSPDVALADATSATVDAAADAPSAEAAPPDASGSDAVCFIDNPPSQAIPICCGLPGQLPYNNCWPREVVDRAMAECVTEGRGLDGLERAIGRRCCAGLAELLYLDVSDAGQCDNPGSPGIRICARCGGGACGRGANRCNCPGDCRAGGDAGPD